MPPDRYWPIGSRRDCCRSTWRPCQAPRNQQSRAKVDIEPKDELRTHDELLKFRAVADQDKWAACWRLTLCGLRRSEVVALKWDAVDLERGEFMVQAGRVSLDGGKRTAIDEPKSTASKKGRSG